MLARGGVAIAGVLSLPSHTRAAAVRNWFSSLVWVVLENRRYGEVAYLRTHQHLAQFGSRLDNYYAVAHPSGPNYRAMASGEIWKPRAETINTPHPTISNAFTPTVPVYIYNLAGQIAARHNPFLDLHTAPARVECGLDKLERDLDLDATSALPDRCIVYVGWDDGHNMHWGSPDDIRTGDACLSALVQVLGRSSWFRQRGANGRYPALFFCYDEDESDRRMNSRVFACWWGAGVTPGHVSNTHYTHYSFCRTVTDNFWGPEFSLGQAMDAAPITDVWG